MEKNKEILALGSELKELVLDDKQFYYDIMQMFEKCKNYEWGSRKELDDFVKNRFNREDYEDIEDDEYIDLQNDIVNAFSDYYNLYESSDTIEAVKSALKSGKIDKKEAQRRMYAIADNDIRDADNNDADNNDAEMMDEADEVNLNKIANAIFDSNEKKGKIDTGFGAKTLDGLKAMIASDYELDEIVNSIFNRNQKRGKINTSWGEKTKEGFKNMLKQALNLSEADEVGTVEVERELDTADLPIQHADEDLVELPVFVVANPDLSDSEFFMVVDNDGDADDGVTIAKLTEDLQEVDHEATLALANELAARLGATSEVVNINALGVDAPDTVGDEGVLDEDGELLLDNEPDGDVNAPVQGGFEIVANEDGTVTFLGDVAELVSELAGDAAGAVMSELSEMPLVDDNLEGMIESAKSKLSAKQKRLAEASEEEFARVVAEHFGVDVEDVEVREESDAGVDYAEVTVEGEEYLVFESYDDAKAVAISRVEDDVVNEPEIFAGGFLDRFISDAGKHYYDDAMYDSYYAYAEDINSENDGTYGTRLAAELVEDDIVAEEDVLDDNGDVRDDFDPTDYLHELAEKLSNDYTNSMEWFSDNFGKEAFNKNVIGLGFIDEYDAATEAVNIDGVAHFLAGYDGNEVDLPDGFVAYRTN